MAIRPSTAFQSIRSGPSRLDPRYYWLRDEGSQRFASTHLRGGKKGRGAGKDVAGWKTGTVLETSVGRRDNVRVAIGAWVCFFGSQRCVSSCSPVTRLLLCTSSPISGSFGSIVSVSSPAFLFNLGPCAGRDGRRRARRRSSFRVPFYG